MARVSYGFVGIPPGADDVYVNVLPPQVQITASGATLQGATVGGGSWGPVGIPLYNGSAQNLIAAYGEPIAGNPAPMVQEGALFLKQSPLGGLITVRATDGTDVAATGYFGPSTSSRIITFTGLYSGTVGNQLNVSVVAGTFPNTLKLLVKLQGVIVEAFDRIPATGSVAYTLTAVNKGSSFNAPSQYIVATAGSSATEMTSGLTVNLAGGLDGFSGLTTADLIGAIGETLSTGMYALMKQKMDVFWLAGCTDSTSWTTMDAFARQTLSMAIGNFPLGTSVATAVTALQSAETDDPYFAVMLGFAVYFDSYLQDNVYVPQASVLAGVCCSLEPHVSPGNKKVYGLLGTDRTYGPLAQDYSNTDIDTLEAAGINLITGTIPAANALGIRHGKNTSTNQAQNEIAYTRKTNDIVRALSGPVMGQFVDLPQGTAPDDPWRESVNTAGNGYFGPQVGSEIDNYTFTCDLTNNSIANIKAGIGQADVLVAYLANVNKFIINITGGQSVDVTVQSVSSGT